MSFDWETKLQFLYLELGHPNSLSDDLCWLMRLDLAYQIDNGMLAYEVGCWLIRLQDVCFE
jgi:hypothetical protein